jgi:hypothetical protein
MANIIAKYTSGSSFMTKTPHLEGQKVFGSMKQKVDIAIGLEGNSHKYDHVIYFLLKVNATSSGFTGSNVNVGKSNIGIVKDETFVLTFQGLKVQECVCKDGV